MGLVLFEEEDVIASFLLGDQSTVGFYRVRRIPDEHYPSQVHVRQVRCHGGLLVGVLRYGNLIDQPLAGSLEVDQHEGFFSLGLLQLSGRIHRSRCLDQPRVFLQPGWSRIGIPDRFAIQVEDLQLLGIQSGHPLRIDLSKLIARDLFEQSLEGPFTRHFKLVARARDASKAQLTTLPVIEALGELADGVGTLTSGGDGQCGHGHHGGQGMTLASRFTPIGQTPACELPKGTHGAGEHRRWGRCRRLSVAQLPSQFLGLELSQGVGTQCPHPKLLGMLLVDVVILPGTLKAFSLAQGLPAGRLVAGAPIALWIDKGLHEQHGMTEVLSPILTQPITRQLQDARGEVGPFASGRQDEKSAVLRDEVSPLGYLPGTPPQKEVAELEVQGG